MQEQNNGFLDCWGNLRVPVRFHFSKIVVYKLDLPERDDEYRILVSEDVASKQITEFNCISRHHADRSRLGESCDDHEPRNHDSESRATITKTGNLIVCNALIDLPNHTKAIGS